MRIFLISVCLVALSAAFCLSPLATARNDAQLTACDGEVPRELEEFQGYLDPAPLGMDIRYAWSLPGGRGENVKLIDIEFNWNLNHTDLEAATEDLLVYVRGIDPLPQLNTNHGTAVLGQLVAACDGVGVTGIAHQAKIGLINPLTEGQTPNVAAAIDRALRHLEAGDVILLEQQSFRGPRLDPSTGRGLLPIEFDPGVFDAIKEATARGIVVIEPAGNGFENLDDPIYNGVFDRNRRDSGAIMVGSGLPPEGFYGPGPDRVKTDESNFGSRVDVQGWGRFVTTCGFGDLRHEQGENNWYTISFGGTSSASAMVAGAVAVLQSIVKARGQAPLVPSDVRRLLAATGSRFLGKRGENIGPRPDLRAALDALDSGNLSPLPLISSVSYKKSKGKLTVDGENFIKGDSIIEIDGTPVTKLKFPAAFINADLASRIITKQSVQSLIPDGAEVSITVFTQSSGKRSAPFKFKNE